MLPTNLTHPVTTHRHSAIVLRGISWIAFLSFLLSITAGPVTAQGQRQTLDSVIAADREWATTQSQLNLMKIALIMHRWQTAMDVATQLQRNNGSLNSESWIDQSYKNKLHLAIAESSIELGDLQRASKAFRDSKKSPLMNDRWIAKNFAHRKIRSRHPERDARDFINDPAPLSRELQTAVSAEQDSYVVLDAAQVFLQRGFTESFINETESEFNRLKRIKEVEPVSYVRLARAIINICRGNLPEAEDDFETMELERKKAAAEDFKYFSQYSTLQSGAFNYIIALQASQAMQEIQNETEFCDFVFATNLILERYTSLEESLRRMLIRWEFADLYSNPVYQTVVPQQSNSRGVRILETASFFVGDRKSELAPVALDFLTSRKSYFSEGLRVFSQRQRSSVDRVVEERLGLASSMCLLAHSTARQPSSQAVVDWLRHTMESSRSLGFVTGLEEGKVRRNERANLSPKDPRAITKDAEALVNEIARIRKDRLLADMSDLRSKLRPNQVILQFAKGRALDLAHRELGLRFLPPAYAGWLVRRDSAPVYANCGPAQEIDGRISTLLTELSQAPARIHQFGEKEAARKLTPVLQKLSQRLLSPFSAQLREGDELFICADGELWLLPWAILPVAEDVALVERYPVTFAFNITDVTDPPQKFNDQRAGRALILSNPDFSATPDALLEAEQKLKVSWSPPPLISPRESRDGGVLTHSTISPRPIVSRHDAVRLLPEVSRLPNTEREAQAIAPALAELTGQEPYIYKGAQSCETLMRRIQRPEFLVLQTHGFFLPSPEAGRRSSREREDTAIAGIRPERGLDEFLSHLPEGYGPVDLTDPMLRSGLLLAGANSCDQWTELRSTEGILTALEAAMLDLRGTKSVVLSACETAVGDARIGEGVAGLRQAFLMAGAESVMASLWPVDDEATADLMIAYFRNLKGGDSKAAALRKAQLALAAERKELYGAAHPYFWAAFTLTGQ